MKKNLATKFAIVVLLTSMLAACAELKPAQNITAPPLRIEFTQWWGDYTLLVAKEKGYFEEYGVEVEPIYYEIFSDTYPDLASGQIDGALIAVGDAINVDRSSPIKIVGIIDDGGDDAVVVGTEINTIEDLRGKTIGMQTGSQYEMTVVKMLQSVNMSTGDVTIVSLNPENTVAALESGLVQAADTWEPYLSDANAAGYKTIYPQEQLHLFPDVIVFNKAITDQRPKEVRAFLKAWFKALEYRMQHEGETRDIAAKYMGINAEDVQPDNNVNLYTINDNKELFDIQKEESIYSITKITSDYLISIGVVVEEIDPLKLLDASYLP